MQQKSKAPFPRGSIGGPSWHQLLLTGNAQGTVQPLPLEKEDYHVEAATSTDSVHSSKTEIPVSAAFPPPLAVFYPTLPFLTIFTAGGLCSQPSPPRTTKFCQYYCKALQLMSHQHKINQLWEDKHLLTRQFFPKNILASGLCIKLGNKTQECFKPFVTGKNIPTQYIFQMFFIILARHTLRNLSLHSSSDLLHSGSRLSLQTHIFSWKRTWFILIPCLPNTSSFPYTLICPLLISAQTDVNVKTGWTSCVCF